MLGAQNEPYNDRFMQFMASKLVRKPKKRNILAYSSLSKNAAITMNSSNNDLSYISHKEHRLTHDNIPQFNTDQKQKERHTVGYSNRLARSYNNPLFAKKLFSDKSHLKTETNS